MKKIQTEIKWSLIFMAAGLAWMALERAAGLHDVRIDRHATYTMLFSIPAIAIYVFALLEKRRKSYEGKMTYMQGFTAGLVITLFVTILSPVSQYITSTLITPHYFEHAIAYSVETGAMTQDAAEAYFNLKSYMIQSVIGGPVMGLITSALVAIFTRKS